jgi:hypothetical protein
MVLNSPSIMHMANTSKRFKEAVQVRVVWCGVVWCGVVDVKGGECSEVVDGRGVV